MNIFSNFLYEAKEKKVSLKTYLSDVYEVIINLPGFKADSDVKKMKIVKTDKEECYFPFKIEFPIDKIRKNSGIEGIEEQFEKYIQSFLTGVLGVVKTKKLRDTMSKYYGGIQSSYPVKHYQVELDHGFKCDCNFTYSAHLDYASEELGRVNFYIELHFYGNPVVVEMKFEECPDIHPNTIFAHIWGYSMTQCNFYIVKNRTNKTVTVAQLGNKYVTGDSQGGSTIPDKKIVSKELKTGRIKDNRTIKVDGDYMSIWNGKPVWVNGD